jgi:hypothetical protein
MFCDAYYALSVLWAPEASQWARRLLHGAVLAMTLASLGAAIGWRATVGHFDGSEMLYYGFLAGISRPLQMFGVDFAVGTLRYLVCWALE